MHRVEPERSNARPASRRRSRCIIFLHVPKTAGWTLRGVLRYKYPSEILFLDDVFDPLGGIETDPARGAASGREWRPGTSSTASTSTSRSHPTTSPSSATRSRASSRCTTTSCGGRSTAFTTSSSGSGMGLEEFARTSTDPGLDNQQTRLISGRGQGEVLPREAGGRDVGRAAARAWRPGAGEAKPRRVPPGRPDRALRRDLHHAAPDVGLASPDVRDPERRPRRERRAARAARRPWRSSGSGSATNSTSSSTSTRAACSRRRSSGRVPRFSARWRRSGR